MDKNLPRGRLVGRRLVVTGGASGIGQATAELFAREGASVFIFDWKISEAARLSLTNLNVGLQDVDISDRAAVKCAVETAASVLGGIDGLVNCAGISPSASFAEMSDEDWDRTIAVNLTGAFNVTKTVLPHLLTAGDASIVNVISGTALLPFKNLSAYIASKGGLNSFSKALAAELGPAIRVNVVSPGIVNTPLAHEVFSSPEAIEEVKSRYVLQKLGEPLDVANAILFLTGAEASQITGVTLAVDGGRTFH